MLKFDPKSLKLAFQIKRILHRTFKSVDRMWRGWLGIELKLTRFKFAFQGFQTYRNHMRSTFSFCLFILVNSTVNRKLIGYPKANNETKTILFDFWFLFPPWLDVFIMILRRTIFNYTVYFIYFQWHFHSFNSEFPKFNSLFCLHYTLIVVSLNKNGILSLVIKPRDGVFKWVLTERCGCIRLASRPSPQHFRGKGSKSVYLLEK